MADELQDGIKHLKEIEQDLEQIKERTTNPRNLFFNGILHGAGAIVGSLVALALLGVILSLLGVIPGVNDIAHYLSSILEDSRIH